MNIISYHTVSDPTPSNLAAALTDKSAGLAAQGRAAIPVTDVRDAAFFGELDPGLTAVAIVEDDRSVLLGILDAVLGQADAAVVPAIAAQISALQS